MLTEGIIQEIMDREEKRKLEAAKAIQKAQERAEKRRMQKMSKKLSDKCLFKKIMMSTRTASMDSSGFDEEIKGSSRGMLMGRSRSTSNMPLHQVSTKSMLDKQSQCINTKPCGKSLIKQKSVRNLIEEKENLKLKKRFQLSCWKSSPDLDF